MWPESLPPAPFYPLVLPMRRVEPVVRIQPQAPDKRAFRFSNDQVGTLIDAYA
jgi:hypothetical protein